MGVVCAVVVLALCVKKKPARNNSDAGRQHPSSPVKYTAFGHDDGIVRDKDEDEKIKNPLYEHSSRSTTPGAEGTAVEATPPKSSSSLPEFDEEQSRAQRLAALRASRDFKKQEEQLKVEQALAALAVVDSLDDA